MIKAIDKWLFPWLLQHRKRARRHITDVMVAVCDHFEPFHDVDKQGALHRLGIWADRLPLLQEGLRDHDGERPRHTFFYPVEQYDGDVISALAGLCRATGNEVEIHLHHRNDTAENLCRQLARGKEALRQHGLLGSGPEGEVVFGFIHGNWALDDSDPWGRGCGVRGELALLKGAGCYADFTMPSAPHPAQTSMVNQLYYARSTMAGKSHNWGVPVSNGQNSTTSLRESPDHLLLLQGPLGLEWRRRKWGILPRIENSDLTTQNPPSSFRMHHWLASGISVVGRPEWLFVKLHTHGGPERNHEGLLGGPARQFHSEIRQMADDGGFRLHYVSAREMVNILHAAEGGAQGDAGQWRDSVYIRPPLLEDI